MWTENAEAQANNLYNQIQQLSMELAQANIKLKSAHEQARAWERRFDELQPTIHELQERVRELEADRQRVRVGGGSSLFSCWLTRADGIIFPISPPLSLFL